MAKDISQMTWDEVTADSRYTSATPEQRANIAAKFKSVHGDTAQPAQQAQSAQAPTPQPQQAPQQGQDITYDAEGNVISGPQSAMASEPTAQGQAAYDAQQATQQTGRPQLQQGEQQPQDLGHQVTNAVGDFVTGMYEQAGYGAAKGVGGLMKMAGEITHIPTLTAYGDRVNANAERAYAEQEATITNQTAKKAGGLAMGVIQYANPAATAISAAEHAATETGNAWNESEGTGQGLVQRAAKAVGSGGLAAGIDIAMGRAGASAAERGLAPGATHAYAEGLINRSVQNARDLVKSAAHAAGVGAAAGGVQGAAADINRQNLEEGWDVGQTLQSAGEGAVEGAETGAILGGTMHTVAKLASMAGKRPQGDVRETGRADALPNPNKPMTREEVRNTIQEQNQALDAAREQSPHHEADVLKNKPLSVTAEAMKVAKDNNIDLKASAFHGREGAGQELAGFSPKQILASMDVNRTSASNTRIPGVTGRTAAGRENVMRAQNESAAKQHIDDYTGTFKSLQEHTDDLLDHVSSLSETDKTLSPEARRDVTGILKQIKKDAGTANTSFKVGKDREGISRDNAIDASASLDASLSRLKETDPQSYKYLLDRVPEIESDASFARRTAVNHEFTDLVNNSHGRGSFMNTETNLTEGGEAPITTAGGEIIKGNAKGVIKSAVETVKGPIARAKNKAEMARNRQVAEELSGGQRSSVSAPEGGRKLTPMEERQGTGYLKKNIQERQATNARNTFEHPEIQERIVATPEEATGNKVYAGDKEGLKLLRQEDLRLSPEKMAKAESEFAKTTAMRQEARSKANQEELHKWAADTGIEKEIAEQAIKNVSKGSAPTLSIQRLKSEAAKLQFAKDNPKAAKATKERPAGMTHTEQIHELRKVAENLSMDKDARPHNESIKAKLHEIINKKRDELGITKEPMPDAEFRDLKRQLVRVKQNEYERFNAEAAKRYADKEAAEVERQNKVAKEATRIKNVELQLSDIEKSFKNRLKAQNAKVKETDTVKKMTDEEINQAWEDYKEEKYPRSDVMNPLTDTQWREGVQQADRAGRRTINEHVSGPRTEAEKAARSAERQGDVEHAKALREHAAAIKELTESMNRAFDKAAKEGSPKEASAEITAPIMDTIGEGLKAAQDGKPQVVKESVQHIEKLLDGVKNLDPDMKKAYKAIAKATPEIAERMDRYPDYPLLWASQDEIATALRGTNSADGKGRIGDFFNKVYSGSGENVNYRDATLLNHGDMIGLQKLVDSGKYEINDEVLTLRNTKKRREELDRARVAIRNAKKKGGTPPESTPPTGGGSPKPNSPAPAAPEVSAKQQDAVDAKRFDELSNKSKLTDAEHKEFLSLFNKMDNKPVETPKPKAEVKAPAEKPEVITNQPKRKGALSSTESAPKPAKPAKPELSQAEQAIKNQKAKVSRMKRKLNNEEWWARNKPNDENGRQWKAYQSDVRMEQYKLDEMIKKSKKK